MKASVDQAKGGSNQPTSLTFCASLPTIKMKAVTGGAARLPRTTQDAAVAHILLHLASASPAELTKRTAVAACPIMVAHRYYQAQATGAAAPSTSRDARNGNAARSPAALRPAVVSPPSPAAASSAGTGMPPPPPHPTTCGPRTRSSADTFARRAGNGSTRGAGG